MRMPRPCLQEQARQGGRYRRCHPRLDRVRHRPRGSFRACLLLPWCPRLLIPSLASSSLFLALLVPQAVLLAKLPSSRVLQSWVSLVVRISASGLPRSSALMSRSTTRPMTSRRSSTRQQRTTLMSTTTTVSPPNSYKSTQLTCLSWW
jgi:hypothetical protein